MTRTRLALIVAAAASTVAVTAGCSAGQGAATLQVKPNYAAGQVANVLAQNVVVVLDPTTGAAQVTGTVINEGTTADQLTAVAVNGQPVPLTSTVGIDGKATLNLASDKGPKLVVTNSGVKSGMNADVTLTFAGAGTLTLNAQSELNTGIYAGFQPSSGS